MSRIAYVNGQYCPHNKAGIHIEDRGYQFSDGVYEVWSIRNGVLQDHQPHMDRLQRSLSELAIPFVYTIASLNIILREVVRRNRITDGLVYLQITRGVAPRDHAWPKDISPSIIITAKAINPKAAQSQAKQGIKVITVPDIRWQRCDIKSVSLLPNVLAKQQAHDKGAFEAWMVDKQGFVTEGSSTNAWIVSNDGVLITRQISQQILSGVTRLTLMQIIKEHKLEVEERKFSVTEAKQAKEAFITSATSLVMPVVQIDDIVIATAKPGALSLQLRKSYIDQGAKQ